jgi:hypothetical protein
MVGFMGVVAFGAGSDASRPVPVFLRESRLVVTVGAQFRLVAPHRQQEALGPAVRLVAKGALAVFYGGGYVLFLAEAIMALIAQVFVLCRQGEAFAVLQGVYGVYGLMAGGAVPLHDRFMEILRSADPRMAFCGLTGDFGGMHIGACTRRNYGQKYEQPQDHDYISP